MPAHAANTQLRASSRETGASVARIASTLFLLSGGFAVAAALQVFFANKIADTPMHTGFPLTFYAAWICAVLGAVSTIVTLFVYGFRARWFWRMLFFAAVLWATLPPLGTAIGIFSLVLLFATRRAFPLDPRDAPAM
jgi:hypothetical protein